MKFFALGSILGMIFSCLPLFSRSAAPAFYPEWAADCTLESGPEVSPDSLIDKSVSIAVPLGETIRLYGADGSMKPSVALAKDELASISLDGRFFAVYKKLGEDIEFRSASGERFWKISSQEYPYVSSTGKVALFLVADLSSVRVIDFNGTVVTKGTISGKMCTSIAFAGKSDWSGIGFLDGGVYVVSDRGDIVYHGSVPKGNVVKSIALSESGKTVAVHYGTTDRDGLMIAMSDNKWKGKSFALPSVLPTKTALNVNDDGSVAILNGDALLLCENDGDIISKIALSPVRPGHAAVVSNGNFYALSYRLKDGGSSLLVFDKKGEILFRRVFPSESFLDCAVRGNLLTVRGISTYYLWRFDQQL